MIVMFAGGGPAQGLYKNVDTKVDEIRVGTAELMAEGRAAVYMVANKEVVPALRITTAVASFAGYRDTAASLVSFVI